MIQTTEFMKVEAYFININQIILYDSGYSWVPKIVVSLVLYKNVFQNKYLKKKNEKKRISKNVFRKKIFSAYKTK